MKYYSLIKKKIESQKLKNTQWYVRENKDLKYKFK